MANIIKKVPAFQTPDGALFCSQSEAEEHMFKAFLLQICKDAEVGRITDEHLEVLWKSRFDLSRIILLAATPDPVE